MRKYKIIYPLFLFVLFNSAVGAEYHVNTAKENQVKFISDAPLEDFEGVTDKIDGYIAGDSENFENAELYFEVDLNSLDTGIGLRNRHMRENYLETEAFPFTHFSAKLMKTELRDDKSYEVLAKGLFSLHGVDREMEISAQIIPFEDGFQITGQFVVKLTDHNIKVPKLMFMKIDENMKVEVDFFIRKSNE